MESERARLATFSDGVRFKVAKSKALLKWPHPDTFLATPDSLSDAGFYFNPSAEDRDNVKCFACDKELSEWDPEDDPHVIHFEKCGQTCPWAIVRCGLDLERDKRGRWVYRLCCEHGSLIILSLDIISGTLVGYPPLRLWRARDFRPLARHGPTHQRNTVQIPDKYAILLAARILPYVIVDGKGWVCVYADRPSTGYCNMFILYGQTQQLGSTR
jgi:hypothetical protein